MSLRWLLATNALVGGAAGVILIVAPMFMASIVGLALDDVGAMWARLYGAELAGFNVATWLAQDRGPDARRIVVLGHAVNESLTFGVLAISIGGLGANAFGWAFAAVALAFAVAFILAATGMAFRDSDK